MNELGCDYACKTVGESIVKYNIPNDWCAEFDIFDGIYPIVCIQIDHLRKIPAMMDLKLRIVESEDDEYAGCMILTEKKTITFKMECWSDFQKAMKQL